MIKKLFLEELIAMKKKSQPQASEWAVSTACFWCLRTQGCNSRPRKSRDVGMQQRHVNLPEGQRTPLLSVVNCSGKKIYNLFLHIKVSVCTFCDCEQVLGFFFICLFVLREAIKPIPEWLWLLPPCCRCGGSPSPRHLHPTHLQSFREDRCSGSSQIPSDSVSLVWCQEICIWK